MPQDVNRENPSSGTGSSYAGASQDYSGGRTEGLSSTLRDEAARLKLEHFDLWRYFQCGAFADDSADRNHLVAKALERVRGCGGPLAAPADVIVIGDTPHDVACALASGATPVGVATGPFSADQLRDSGAAVVFEDLSDTEAFVQLLESRPDATASGRSS